MSDPLVSVQLDGDRQQYAPGDTLAGEFHIDPTALADPKAVELSVLWHTEGLGDEDLVVHYFERIADDEGEQFDTRRPHRFSVKLPASPVSYDGVIVKIRWCVRVRLFPARGKETLVEVPFTMGDVAPGQEVVYPEEPASEEGSHTESELM